MTNPINIGIISFLAVITLVLVLFGFHSQDGIAPTVINGLLVLILISGFGYIPKQVGTKERGIVFIIWLLTWFIMFKK